MPQTIWELDAVTVCLDENVQQVRKQVTKSVSEDDPLRLSFASIYLKTELSYPLNHDGLDSAAMAGMTVMEGPVNLLLESGEGVSLEVSPIGTEEGVSIELVSLEPVIGATGQASLAPTYTYTETYLTELSERVNSIMATDASTLEEKNCAGRIADMIAVLRNSKGDSFVYVNGIEFVAPRNYTGNNLYYRIIITAKESDDVFLNVDITVRPEADELRNAVSDLDAAVARGDQERARESASEGEPSEDEPGPTEDSP